MVKRKMLALLMITMLSLVASSTLVQAATSEVWNYEGAYDNEINITVEATTSANPGDTIDVTVIGEASADLENVDIYIYIQGTTDEGTETWATDEEYAISDDMNDNDDFEESFEFDVDDNSDSGMIIGHIVGEWTIFDDDLAADVDHSFDIAFPITFISGGISEEDYTALQTTYTQLQTQYAALEDDVTELEVNNSELTLENAALNTAIEDLTTIYDALQTDLDELSNDLTDLETQYNALNTQYNSLQTESDALQEKYDATVAELNTNRTYLYVFIATTGIALVATIWLASKNMRSS